MNFFRRLQPVLTPRDIPPVVLPNGTSIPVTVRLSARAERVAIRLHPSQRDVELVLPHGFPLARALAFLNERRGWIATQAQKLPPQIPFADGAVIPVLGIAHVLRALGPRRGFPPFRITEEAIEVTGSADHLARRTQAGLCNHARQMLADRTAGLAARLGQPIGRITVGDASSRWGSCASSGNIKYSWRLVMAPERVLDYVVAHEVAHLVEMNHSQRFWRVVETLHPDYAQERDWLKRHGAQLHRYGGR
jgi:predicted metal-dependent hydrolase